jgi:hypothetical protein
VSVIANLATSTANTRFQLSTEMMYEKETD